MRSGGVYLFYAVMKFLFKRLDSVGVRFFTTGMWFQTLSRMPVSSKKKLLRQTPPNATKREKEVANRFSWISKACINPRSTFADLHVR